VGVALTMCADWLEKEWAWFAFFLIGWNFSGRGFYPFSEWMQ